MWTLALLPLTVACTDYDFKGGADVSGADSGADGGDGGGSTDGGTTTPQGGPPEEVIPECDPGATATMSPAEIYVTSWDTPVSSATLSASEAGYYDVYDYSIAESGDTQWNESGYIRVTNVSNPDGAPVYANCGYEWLVIDSDNYGPLPEGSRIYLGTFYLDAGDNTLTLYHYCPLYRDGQCLDFQITVNDDTCDNGGANSVHVFAEGICLESTHL